VLRTAGDCILPFPIAPRVATDPDLARVVDLFRDATLAMANLETSIVDLATPGLAPRVVDDWCLSALPSVAADLRALGFTLLGRANNHAMDWGPEGMRQTGARLDAVGIVHGGAADHLAMARAPVYAETSHGRVGMVAVYPTGRWDPDAATDPFRAVPGRPGVNALRLERIVSAPPAAIAGIKEIARAIDVDGQVADGADALRIDDTRYEEGASVSVRYEPAEQDMAEILRSVRQGAQHADLLVVTAHAHQEGVDAVTPPTYLQAFARAAIDAGASAFVGHGVHRLWPVELYRERPIFYGLGNLVFSDIQEPLHEAMHRSVADRLPSSVSPDTATDADVAAALTPSFDGDRYYEAAIAELAVRDDALTAKVIPLDLRRGARPTVKGIPRIADPALATDILKRVDAMSAPFGTGVDADGVLRPR
jgi:poly-gamma-glutamate synthesis protein (capsule biosynthesis protein)